MDLVAGCADQISLRSTDNSSCSSKLMLAEVQSNRNSSGIIGRRRDEPLPDFFVFTNPFRMLEQIQLLPEGDRQQLAAAGIKILIAGRVIEAEPSIANDRPRNWSSKATQRDADGVYLGDRRAVVVAERTRSGPSNRAEGVLRHEVGHALNDAFGRFSESAEFVHAYQADVNSMDRAQQSRMAFWRQARGAGRDETFADVYAALRGGVPNAEETRLISQSFPRVTALVRGRIGP